jgi:threonine dehydrogenase-like Zn-dependent dehydrogenase
VVGEINCPCGRCALCRRGLGKHCPRRSVLGIQGRDGAFADFLVLPDGNLHVVPEGVADREAVFTEPLAAAWQALIQGSPSRGEGVVVLGDGRLGLLVAMVFAAEGVQVTLLGKHEEKLALARGAGAKTRLIGGSDRLPQADLVVEATGHSSGLETALRIVRPAGRIVLKTTVAGPHAIGLAPLVVNEVTVIGSRCGPFDRALGSLASRSVDVSALVSAEFPMEKGIEAMHAAAGPLLKVLLVIA